MILVHLGGLIVAIILLVRRRSTPAILALVAFGLLLVTSFASLFRGALINQFASQMRYGQIGWLVAGIGCCCSILDVIAFICLIVAIWQAVSGVRPAVSTGVDTEAVPAETVVQGTSDSEILEGIIEIPDEPSDSPTQVLVETDGSPPVSGEAPPSHYATRVLDEALEEEAENPYATRVLSEAVDDETAKVPPDSE